MLLASHLPLAMHLNDEAGDVERQRLLPFVTRLACADTPEVERARAAYIASQAGPFLTFEKGLKVLDGALAIGRHADPFAPDKVRTRLDAAAKRRCRQLGPRRPMFTSSRLFRAEAEIEPTRLTSKGLEVLAMRSRCRCVLLLPLARPAPAAAGLLYIVAEAESGSSRRWMRR